MSLDHLSYSSINLYLSCPEAWRRKYIAKERTFSNTNLVLGSAIHGTIERYISLPEKLEDGKEPEPQKDLLTLWDEEWKEQITSSPVEGQTERQPKTDIFWGVDSPEMVYNEGVRLLSHKTVQEAISKIKPLSNELIEKEIKLQVPGVPVPITGRIDIVLDDGTPADLKTSSKSWSEQKADDELQTLYYLAAMNQMGIPVNWKFKHIVFVKTKEPKVQFLEHSHNAGELFFLFELIKRVWQGIEKQVFLINPTTWKCSPTYCDFYANCRGKYG